MSNRDQLLKLLRDFACMGIEVKALRTHEIAEHLILAILNDPELTFAWIRASYLW